MSEINIDEMLTALYALESSLAITSPIATSIKKVWPFLPPGQDVINDTPCFTNMWTAPTLEFRSALMTLNCTVNAHLLVFDTDLEDAAKIATAFYPKVVAALAANVKLGLSGWTIRQLRGAGETLRVFPPESDVKGRTFIGLDLFIDLFWKGGVAISSGA